MARAFEVAEAFTSRPLGSWKTDAVTDMTGMFNQAHDFNQALNSWRTSSVTDMAAMFLGAKKSNLSSP